MRSVLAREQLLPSPHGWGVSRWREPSPENHPQGAGYPGGALRSSRWRPPSSAGRGSDSGLLTKKRNFPSAAIGPREFWNLASLQVLSHGTSELAKPLIQPSRFIGKETEAQRGELISLRWPYESVQGWGRNSC